MGMCVWVYEGGSLLTVSSCVVRTTVSLAVYPWVISSVCVSLSGVSASPVCPAGHMSPSCLAIQLTSLLPLLFLLWGLGRVARHHCRLHLAVSQAREQAACVTPCAEAWLRCSPCVGPCACARALPSPWRCGGLLHHPRSPSEPFPSCLLLPSCVRPASVKSPSCSLLSLFCC